MTICHANFLKRYFGKHNFIKLFLTGNEIYFSQCLPLPAVEFCQMKCTGNEVQMQLLAMDVVAQGVSETPITNHFKSK